MTRGLEWDSCCLLAKKFTTHFQMKQLLKYAAQISVIFYDYNMWVVMVWDYNIQIFKMWSRLKFFVT